MPEAASAAPPAAGAQPAPLLGPEELRRTVADVLGTAPEQIGDDDNLVALGVDSVKVMAISAQLRRYRVRLRFARMIEEPTLRAWWLLVGESTATDAGRAAGASGATSDRAAALGRAAGDGHGAEPVGAAPEAAR